MSGIQQLKFDCFLLHVYLSPCDVVWNGEINFDEDRLVDKVLARFILDSRAT